MPAELRERGEPGKISGDVIRRLSRRARAQELRPHQGPSLSTTLSAKKKKPAAPSHRSYPLGHASFGFKSVHVAQRWQRRLEKALEPVGLTHLQFILLATIDWLERSGEVPSQARLANFTLFDRVMISKVLTLLVQKGLIVRDTHPTVAKAKRVDLTTAGRQALARARPLWAETEERYFGQIGTERMAVLGALLDELLEGSDER
jgi:DNA-binding MarR family transcriptional regulator